MKNLLLTLLAVVAISSSSCFSDNDLRGSTNIVSEIRTVTGFDRVLLFGVVDVNIIQGSDFSVTVRANDNLIQFVRTNLNGTTLDIGMATGNFRDINAEVDVVVPTLAGITLTSTGDALAENFSGQPGLTIDMSSTGSVSINNSSTDLLTANLSGTGDLQAFGLTATTAEVNTTGTGSAEVTVTTDLTGSITGTGDISFRGNPTVEVTVTGTGEVVDAN